MLNIFLLLIVFCFYQIMGHSVCPETEGASDRHVLNLSTTPQRQQKLEKEEIFQI